MIVVKILFHPPFYVHEDDVHFHLQSVCISICKVVRKVMFWSNTRWLVVEVVVHVVGRSLNYSGLMALTPWERGNQWGFSPCFLYYFNCYCCVLFGRKFFKRGSTKREKTYYRYVVKGVFNTYVCLFVLFLPPPTSWWCLQRSVRLFKVILVPPRKGWKCRQRRVTLGPFISLCFLRNKPCKWDDEASFLSVCVSLRIPLHANLI